MWARVLFDLGFSTTSFYQELQQYTNLTSDEVHKEGYFGVAKVVINDILTQFNASNLILTGHSLGFIQSDIYKFILISFSLIKGASLAQMVSIYLEDDLDIIVPTITFSSPGTQCVLRRMGYLTENKNRSQINNYFSEYDIVGTADYPIGLASGYVPDTSEYLMLGTDTAKEACRPTFGFGIESAVLATNIQQYTYCTRRTHDFFALYEDLVLRFKKKIS